MYVTNKEKLPLDCRPSETVQHTNSATTSAKKPLNEHLMLLGFFCYYYLDLDLDGLQNRA